MTKRDVPKRWSIWTRLRAAIKLLISRRLWRLDIGRGTFVHPAALLDRTWPRGLHIGRDCIIGADASILTHDFTRGLLTDTWIGDGCAIGERVIVMPGIRIGKDCIVVPGAVVTRDVPDGSIAYGNPAVSEERPAPGAGISAAHQMNASNQDA